MWRIMLKECPGFYAKKERNKRMSKEFPFYIIIKKWGKNVHVMSGKISIIYNIKAFIDVITVFIVVGRKLLRAHIYRE